MLGSTPATRQSTATSASSYQPLQNPILKHGTLIVELSNPPQQEEPKPKEKQKRKSALNLFAKRKKDAERDRQRELLENDKDRAMPMSVMLVWVRTTEDIAIVAESVKTGKAVTLTDTLRGGRKTVGRGKKPAPTQTETIVLGQLTQTLLDRAPTLIVSPLTASPEQPAAPPTFISLPSYNLLTEIDLGAACRFALRPSAFNTPNELQTYNFRAPFAQEYLEWTRVLAGTIDFFWRLKRSGSMAGSDEGSGSESDMDSTGSRMEWLRSPIGVGYPYQSGVVGTFSQGIRGGAGGHSDDYPQDDSRNSSPTLPPTPTMNAMRSVIFPPHPAIHPTLTRGETSTMSRTEAPMFPSLPRTATPAVTTRPEPTPLPQTVPGSPLGLLSDPSTLDLAQLPDDDSDSTAHNDGAPEFPIPNTLPAAPALGFIKPPTDPASDSDVEPHEVYDRDRVQGVLQEVEARDAADVKKKASDATLSVVKDEEAANKRHSAGWSDSGIGSEVESGSEDELQHTARRIPLPGSPRVQSAKPTALNTTSQALAPPPHISITGTDMVKDPIALTPSPPTTTAQPSLLSSAIQKSNNVLDTGAPFIHNRLDEEMTRRRSFDVYRDLGTGVPPSFAYHQMQPSAQSNIVQNPFSSSPISSQPVPSSSKSAAGAITSAVSSSVSSSPPIPINWALLMSGRRLTEEVERRLSLDDVQIRREALGNVKPAIPGHVYKQSKQQANLSTAATTSPLPIKAGAKPLLIHRPISLPVAGSSLPPDWALLMSGRKIDEEVRRRSLDLERKSDTSSDAKSDTSNTSNSTAPDWSLLMSGRKLDEEVRRRSLDLDRQNDSKSDVSSSVASNVSGTSMETHADCQVAPTELDVHVDVRGKTVIVNQKESKAESSSASANGSQPGSHAGGTSSSSATFPRSRPVPLPWEATRRISQDVLRYVPSSTSPLSSPPLVGSGAAPIVAVRRPSRRPSRPDRRWSTFPDAATGKTLKPKYSFEEGDDRTVELNAFATRRSLDSQMDRRDWNVIEVTEAGTGPAPVPLEVRSRRETPEQDSTPMRPFVPKEEFSPKRKSVFTLFSKNPLKSKKKSWDKNWDKYWADKDDGAVKNADLRSVIQQDSPITGRVSADVVVDGRVTPDLKGKGPVLEGSTSAFQTPVREMPTPVAETVAAELATEDAKDAVIVGVQKAETAKTEEVAAPTTPDSDAEFVEKQLANGARPLYSSTPPPSARLLLEEGSTVSTDENSSVITAPSTVVEPPSSQLSATTPSRLPVPASSRVPSPQTASLSTSDSYFPRSEQEKPPARAIWHKARDVKVPTYRASMDTRITSRGSNDFFDRKSASKRMSMDQGGLLNKWFGFRSKGSNQKDESARSFSLTGVPPVTVPTSDRISRNEVTTDSPFRSRTGNTSNKQQNDSQSQADSRIRAVIAAYTSPSEPHRLAPIMARTPSSENQQTLATLTKDTTPAPRTSLELAHPIPQFEAPEVVTLKNKKEEKDYHRARAFSQTQTGPAENASSSSKGGQAGDVRPRISLEDPAGPRVWNEKTGAWEDLVAKVQRMR
ncbi:hypothetical protein HK097_000673 [Rhizophlyctis rosea]|uniref:Uncharacterized protein n=1 Tax=Rhizophlyctis rosea TaxID=64517 RepID=A0AAD5S5A7_9FUNG|nr:hypothetical protein HK097_000673 [Rhizophlyctis rosea]